MPYAVQSEAIYCALLSFTFRTAMAAWTYNTSGTYLLLSQYLVLGVGGVSKTDDFSGLLSFVLTKTLNLTFL